MAAGDLIEFEVSDKGDMRLADLPRLVTRRSHPALAAELKRAGARTGRISDAFGGEMPKFNHSSDAKYTQSQGDRAANVIPFSRAPQAAYA